MDDAATSRAPIDGEPRAHVRGVALALAGALAFAGALAPALALVFARAASAAARAPAAADQNTGPSTGQNSV